MAHIIQKYTIKSPSIVHARWERVLLLVIIGYEAAGCLTGGVLLLASPDGNFLDMPVEIMNGTFQNFMIPGIILFGMGLITTVAFLSILKKVSYAWIFACTAMGGLLMWFWIEIAILQELHWLHAMWGLPVIAGAILAVRSIPSFRHILPAAALYCGILSSVLYLAINIIVPVYYPGYSVTSQVVSELSAIGAPTKMLWTVLATPYTFLMMAFAWGIWKSAGKNRNLRIAGISMMAYGALGFLWPLGPMHQREVLVMGGGTFQDILHIALGAVTQLFYLIALWFAARSLGKEFRLYSIATFVILLFFGVLTFMEAPNLSLNEPTPLIGVWERINIGVFLLWVIVLAIVLLKKRHILNMSDKLGQPGGMKIKSPPVYPQSAIHQ